MKLKTFTHHDPKDKFMVDVIRGGSVHGFSLSRLLQMMSSVMALLHLVRGKRIKDMIYSHVLTMWKTPVTVSKR